MRLREFKQLKYGDRIQHVRNRRNSYTVIEPFNLMIDCIRLAWHGQTFMVSDPRWWVKLPERGPRK